MQKFELLSRCTIKGQGNPILLAHGIGGAKIWETVVDVLAEHFMVIVPTFPGFDKTDGEVNYSDDLYINFMEELRKELKLKKWNVAGISMGGRSVLNYALKHRNRVLNIILIDSLALNNLLPMPNSPTFEKIILSFVSRHILKPYILIQFGAREFKDKKHKAIKEHKIYFKKLMESKSVQINFHKILSQIMVGKKIWQDLLPSLTHSTLILWASEDKVAPIESAYTLHSLIKNSKLSVIDGYGHAAILEKPEFFTEEIISFLLRESAQYIEEDYASVLNL